jgi:hypothetical protein
MLMANPKANIIIFEPLSIRTNNPKSVFDTHRDKISKKIVEAILHCIKFGKSKTVFAELIVPSSKEIIYLNVDESSFLETLETNMDVLIENEEYELCAEIMKAKEKIIKGLPKKSSRKKKKEATDDLINAIKKL